MLNILLFLFAMVREVGQLLVVSKRQQLGLNKKKQQTATKVESEGDNKGEGKKAATKTPGSDTLRQRKGAK
ncbi:hypothetical protein HDU79_009824 [Rhizoclosmatium sp. JEL0117]|nr:hypothetical protein HDU79_009824 [Rhizoclosmatium sp. JEL0117]